MKVQTRDEKINHFAFQLQKYNELLQHSQIPTLDVLRIGCVWIAFASTKLNCCVRFDHFTCRKCLCAYKTFSSIPTTLYQMLTFFPISFISHIAFTCTHTHTHTHITLHYEQCTQPERWTWTVNRISFVCIRYSTQIVVVVVAFLLLLRLLVIRCRSFN